MTQQADVAVPGGEEGLGSFSPEEAKIPTELVARLEVAAKGSRELDDSVVIAATGGEMMDWWDEASQQHVIKAGDGSRVNVTPVTTSLDAALALAERVLPGWGTDHDGTAPECGIDWSVHHPKNDPANPNRQCTGTAATHALALCIAVLKATTASAVGTKAPLGRSEPQNDPLPKTGGQSQ